MKNASIALLLLLTFSGCKKTIHSLSMIGTWVVDSYYENGADKTTDFKNVWVNYKIKFDAAGNYIETATVLGVDMTNAGPWKLINNGSDIELTNQSNNSKRYFHIIDLKTYTAKISEDNGAKEYHLLKQ